MVSLNSILKEKKMMSSLKKKIESANIGILHDIDIYFNRHPNKGFSLKTLNKLFIESGFIYDNEADRFECDIYNTSIDRYIHICIYNKYIMFECGSLNQRTIYEIPNDLTDEQIRLKMIDLLNNGADLFIESLKDYANEHDGRIDDKEDDTDE